VRSPGEPIVRRDVWHGRPWVGWSGIVVQDAEELLVLYMPEGGEIAVAEGDFPGEHPWQGKGRWRGHGVLQLQRPDEMYAVWVFWSGPERRLSSWYLNIQEPYRRTSIGFDTQDLELDLVVRPDGTWRWKDEELLEGWVERGRWSPAEVAAIRAEGERLAADIDAGRRWWSEDWATWQPDPGWSVPRLPAGWEHAE
jgi:hypothetical protein